MNLNEVIHYRRCHVCGAVSELKCKIERCNSCGKSISPFFYFDDLLAPVPAEDLLRPPFAKGEVRPIVGLTAYW